MHLGISEIKFLYFLFLIACFFIIVSKEDDYKYGQSSPHFLTVIEGQDVEIVFLHPFHVNSSFNLRREHGYPFHQNGRFVNDGSRISERFRVEVGKVMENLIIRLEILNTKREDSGTYVCEVSVPDENLTTPSYLVQRVSLTVNYPPGKTTCRFLSHPVNVAEETWRFIECHAKRGSITGFIQCFQQGMTVAPRTRLAKNSSVLIQQFTVKDAIPFSCCTSVFLSPKTLDACGDFKQFQEENESEDLQSNDRLAPSVEYTTRDIVTHPIVMDFTSEKQTSSMQSPGFFNFEYDSFKINSVLSFSLVGSMIFVIFIICCITLAFVSRNRTKKQNERTKAPDESDPMMAELDVESEL